MNKNFSLKKKGTFINTDNTEDTIYIKFNV